MDLFSKIYLFWFTVFLIIISSVGISGLILQIRVEFIRKIHNKPKYLPLARFAIFILIAFILAILYDGKYLEEYSLVLLIISSISITLLTAKKIELAASKLLGALARFLGIKKSLLSIILTFLIFSLPMILIYAALNI